MPIQMQCPQCQAKAALPDNHAGRPVRCKVCKATFTIPKDAGAHPDQPAVIDRYLVRELLGEGAFGCVYRAFDPRLERDVALKVLRAQMMSSAQAVERFLREAKSAAKLLHPNIVPVYDAGRSGSLYYIASAYIHGMTLASTVPEEGGMEPSRAVRLTAQLATALGYAHQQGILHRDVKPANAMVNEQDSLHLMDFGLAGWTQEESTRLTRLGAVMGTPAYMAPEQALGDTKNVGPAADLYGAGVVLYELLTSRLPFDGGHAMALTYQIVHTPPTPLSQHVPGLDPGLEAICLKALAKKPEDRYVSGEEMAAALMQWTPAAPVAMPAPVVQPAKATVAPLALVFPKQTVLPSSGKLAARRSLLFDRETVMPAAAKRSTLESPPAAPTQGGILRNQNANRRRSLMLGGAVFLAVAGLLLLAMLIWLSSSKHPPKAEYVDGGERQPTEPALVSRPDVETKPDSQTETPLITPPPKTVEPPETSGPPAVSPATVDPPVIPQQVSPPVSEPAVVPPPKPPPEPTLANDITNGIGMKLKLIKAGKFLMGSPTDEKDSNDDEGPQHEVEITRRFYVGVYPVTVGQFAAFVKDAHYTTDGEVNDKDIADNGAAGRPKGFAKYTWRNPGNFVQTDENPVVCVSWNDAMKFCDWLSQKEKKTYGLPTEAQWEYACRAGTTTAFSFGDNPNAAGDYAWSGAYSEFGAQPVGGRKPNRWGLFDMNGNVYQWCADYYNAKYYTITTNKDPQNILMAEAHVLRGGSWRGGATFCRAAFRFWGRGKLTFRGDCRGFRVVMRPAEPPIPANPTPTPAADLAKFDPLDAPPVVNPSTTQTEDKAQLKPPPEDKPADEITNVVGIPLKLIKPGKFLMGSPQNMNHLPQHEVEITRPFYMGVYPVTVGQFAAFVKDANYTTDAEQTRGKQTWRTFMQMDDAPVTEVSWNDAVKFCDWLSRKEKRSYKLPTEAQWEYACRAGTAKDYNNHWYGGAGEWHYNTLRHTQSFDYSRPNPWGLFYMAPRYEWCADYYDANYYQNSPNKDPQNSLETNARVLRGGFDFVSRDMNAPFSHRDFYEFRVCLQPD